MHSWFADLIKSWGGVILGWGLGLAGGPIVEWGKKRKRVRAIKVAVSQDLQELALRLMMVAWQAKTRQGRLNRGLLEWIRPRLQRYEGPNPGERLLENVEGLLKSSDEELDKVAVYARDYGTAVLAPSGGDLRENRRSAGPRP